MFFSILAFYLFSPPTPSPPKPIEPSHPREDVKPTLNLSRVREREWATQLPRGMIDITGEGGLMDSSEEERLLKKEEEEEEDEWERLKGVEAERARDEEEREALELAQENEFSSGEETVAGGRAVQVKAEDEEDDARSVLGGVRRLSFLFS